MGSPNHARNTEAPKASDIISTDRRSGEGPAATSQGKNGIEGGNCIDYGSTMTERKYLNHRKDVEEEYPLMTVEFPSSLSPATKHVSAGSGDCIDIHELAVSPPLAGTSKNGKGAGDERRHRVTHSSLMHGMFCRQDHDDDDDCRTLGSAVDSIFSSVRSVSTEDVEAEMNDSEKYRKSSIWARAFPERFFALLVTLCLELPVLFMISGGSERLCIILGRKRYQLLIAFLPLTSAISGNVGLQESTLATRAVSHMHITKETYVKWLLDEMAASFLLGIAMGTVLGLCAFQAAGFDIVFGATIAIAQVLSILTAGFTGTVAPLIFTFIFHRDSGKWGGPLETAIQDIVGSFAMVVLSYHLLVFFGTEEIEPWDVCGASDLED